MADLALPFAFLHAAETIHSGSRLFCLSDIGRSSVTEPINWLKNQQVSRSMSSEEGIYGVSLVSRGDWFQNPCGHQSPQILRSLSKIVSCLFVFPANLCALQHLRVTCNASYFELAGSVTGMWYYLGNDNRHMFNCSPEWSHEFTFLCSLVVRIPCFEKCLCVYAHFYWTEVLLDLRSSTTESQSRLSHMAKLRSQLLRLSWTQVTW